MCVFDIKYAILDMEIIYRFKHVEMCKLGLYIIA